MHDHKLTADSRWDGCAEGLWGPGFEDVVVSVKVSLKLVAPAFPFTVLLRWSCPSSDFGVSWSGPTSSSIINHLLKVFLAPGGPKQTF